MLVVHFSWMILRYHSTILENGLGGHCGHPSRFRYMYDIYKYIYTYVYLYLYLHLYLYFVLISISIFMHLLMMFQPSVSFKRRRITNPTVKMNVKGLNHLVEWLIFMEFGVSSVLSKSILEVPLVLSSLSLLIVVVLSRCWCEPFEGWNGWLLGVSQNHHSCHSCSMCPLNTFDQCHQLLFWRLMAEIWTASLRQGKKGASKSQVLSSMLIFEGVDCFCAISRRQMVIDGQ